MVDSTNNDWQRAVVAAVKDTASSLLGVFAHTEPLASFDELREVFGRVNGGHEETLRERIGQVSPGAGWVEDDLSAARLEPGASGDYWVCDVIDGAVQFFQGVPAWCVTLGYVERGEVAFAVTVDALHDVLYVASAGGGAYRNGRKIGVGRKASLSSALVAMNHPPFAAERPADIALASRAWGELASRSVAVRSLGPTSLQIADVASGRLDLFWQFGEDPANCLASALIAREAGARVLDARGEPWTARSSSIVVGSPALVAEALALPGFGPGDEGSASGRGADQGSRKVTTPVARS